LNFAEAHARFQYSSELVVGNKKVFPAGPWTIPSKQAACACGAAKTGEGRYRLCYRRPGLSGPVKKFLAPHIREILEQSGRKIDLSGYF